MKITTQQAMQLRAALLSLDGLERAVETEGKTTLIKKPFKLAGKTRLKIARNLGELEAVATDYDKARVNLIREMSDGGEEVPEARKKEFFQQMNAMLAEEHEVALRTLDENELNLDANEIPHGVVMLLLAHLTGAGFGD